MAVIYLFDAAKQLRRPVQEGVQEIIHSEGEYSAVTQILAKDAPEYGDYFGFKCMDGRFRLFGINGKEINDDAGTCMLTGTDAAITELEGRVVTELPLQNTTAGKAAEAALQGTGWSIGTQTGDGEVNIESAYFATLWATIKKIAAAGGVRAVPYYEFSGNRISAKRIDLMDKTPVFSGLIYTRKRGAENIHIMHEGMPYGRVFPIGKIIGDSEPPEQVTIAGAVWSMENGDPADKPAGQKYIDLPGAISDAEYVYEDKKETDPVRLMQKAFEDLKATKKPIASGTANISDMEYMPGYEHMKAKMWMKAAVRAETGQMVETTIINIERYYVHRELTKITVGDENANEDMLENMISSIRAELLDAAKAAGGGRAGAGKAKQMVLEAEELIELNSKQIVANAEQLITLRTATTEVREDLNDTITSFNETKLVIEELKGELSTTKTDVNNAANKVDQLKGSVTTLAGEVELKAAQSSLNELGKLVEQHEAYIKVLPEQIDAKADKIVLEGYVKVVGELEARIATIDKFFTGETYAQSMGISGTLYAENVNFPGNVSIKNRVMNLVSMSMGDVASHTILGAGTGAELDLQHSHAIEYDAATGKFTLAGVSSSGGSFSIADTQFYKDGVAAAAGLVTLTTQGWVGKQNTVRGSNGKTAAVLLPSMTVKSVDEWNSLHKTYARIGYRDTTGSEVEAGFVEVDANDVYTAGREAGLNEAGTDFSEGYEQGKLDWAPAELVRAAYSAANKTITVRAENENDVHLIVAEINASEIYEKGQTDWQPAEIIRTSYDTTKKTVTVQAENQAGVPVLSLEEIDASEIWQAGEDSVTLTGAANWADGKFLVKASNGKAQYYVGLPEFDTSGGDVWKDNKTTVFFYTDSVNEPLETVEVDATVVYAQGQADWQPVSVERYEYDAANKTVTVRAKNAAGTPVLGGQVISASEIYKQGEKDWKPVEIIRTSYDTTKKTVTVRAENQAGVPVLSLEEIDASEIWQAGFDNVYISSAEWVYEEEQCLVTASNGAIGYVGIPGMYCTAGDEWTDEWKKTVECYTYASPKVQSSIEIDASDVYKSGKNAGAASVKLSGDTTWKDGTFLVTASNGEKFYVGLPAFETSGGTFWSNNKTTVYFSTPSVNVPLKSVEVDATELVSAAYEQGWRDAIDSSVIKYSNFKITNTAPNKFFGSVTVWTRFDEDGDRQEDANTRSITHTQTINVGQ